MISLDSLSSFYVAGKDSNDQEVSQYTHFSQFEACTIARFCVRIPIKTVKVYDQDAGAPYYIAVKAFNIANLPTVGKSSPFTVPSVHAPPQGMVFDVSPKYKFPIMGKHDQQRYEADFQFDGTKICARWRSFEHYKDPITYTVGAGTTPGLDNVASFKNVNDSTFHCFTGLNLAHLTRYFTTVKAQSAAGTTTGSTDGIVYINESTALSNSKVLDGAGCERSYINDDFKGGTLSKGAVLTGVGKSEYLFGQHFSIEIETDKINTTLEVKVNDVIVGSVLVDSQLNTRDVHYVDFVALHHNLTIEITNIGFNTVAVHNYKVRKCENDVDYQVTRSVVYARWNMRFENSLHPHITHYEAAVTEYTCDDIEQQNCQDVGLITDYKVTGLNEKYSFTDVQLKSGYGYKVSVRACFMHICLAPKVSNGFIVLDKRPQIGSLTASYIYSKINETLPQMNFTANWQPFALNCGQLTDQVSLYEWAVSTTKDFPELLTPWTAVAYPPSGDAYEVGGCEIKKATIPHIYTHVFSFQCLK